MAEIRRPILLLGRDGQLGFELARALSTQGDLVAWGRAELDLARPEAIARRIAALAPGLIVNAAAYTAVDAAEDDEDTAFVVNAAAPAALARAARAGDAALVHFSTDYVFDGAARDRPRREDDPVAPLGVYGRSKLAGEEEIRASRCVHLIVRTAWVYGNRGRNFLLTMRRLGRERARLAVVDDQIGGPTWSRLLAEATAQILAQTWLTSGTAGVEDVAGTYHLACAGATSWHGFARAIFAALAAAGETVPRLDPIPTASYPTRARRPAYAVLDCGKARRTFGIALPDWEAALGLCLGDRGPA
jgi:dTDP-4-dehydrorhamnose reductase